MRLSTLSAVCATALILPISAAPLATTTALPLPLVSSVQVGLNTPPEIPNPDHPLPTFPAKPNMAAGRRKNQVDRLSKGSKLSRLPRADFRQADYGVNHNVTLVHVPVQGVEATPSSGSPSALSRRSEDDWEANRLHSDYASAAAPSGGLPDTAPDAPYASDSVPASAAAPLAVGDISKANANSIPAHPNLSSVSNIAGKGIQSAGESRYKTAYAAHDTLGALAVTKPAMAQSGPTQLGMLNPATAAHSLLPRVLQRGRDLIAPLKRAFELGRGIGAHTLELNTDPILPSRPDETLNMSDPYVAQEEMRRQHAGVLNIDSNRAAPPPPAALPADTPLGAKNTTTELDDKEGGAKNATMLPINHHSKNPVGAAEKKATKA